MKATSVRYEVVKSDGNWGNTRVGIEVAVEEGESAQTALERARLFVQHNLPDPHFAHRLESARRILANPDDHTIREVREAEAVLEGLATPADIGL